MLKQRIITACILAPLALFGVFGLSLSSFMFALDAVIIVAAWEWANLSGYQATISRYSYVALMAVAVGLLHVAYMQVPLDWLLISAVIFWGVALFWVMKYPQINVWKGRLTQGAIGFVVLLPCWLAFVMLKASEHGGLLLLFILLLVWGADIGAYFAGKRFGKNKLAPAVSPGKTREGLYGGVAVCLVVATVFSVVLSSSILQSVSLVLLALCVGLISVLGDLFESMLKRHRGIKDSSQLLPGHGGVLDRIDSLTAAAPLFVLGMHALLLL